MKLTRGGWIFCGGWGDGFGGWRGVTDMQAHREMRNYFDDAPVDVVIMNPPFSQSQNRKKGSEVTDEHVAAAFSNARLGARAVVITGHNWTPTAATHRRAFELLAKKGWRRRGSIQVAGELYAAYGTSFPVRMTVFDNLGPDAPAAEDIFEAEAANLGRLCGGGARDSGAPAPPCAAGRRGRHQPQRWFAFAGCDCGGGGRKTSRAVRAQLRKCAARRPPKPPARRKTRRRWTGRTLFCPRR